MDSRRQYELEGKFNLPREIVNTWYADDSTRYTGGFFKLRVETHWIWAHLFLRKEELVSKKVKVYKHKRLFGFVPCQGEVSVKEEPSWVRVWEISTYSEYSNGAIIHVYPEKQLGDDSLFDSLKAAAARQGMMLGKGLICGVFGESVDTVMRLHHQVFGHN